MTRDEMIAALEYVQRRDALLSECKARYATTWELPLRQWSGDQLSDTIATQHGLPLGTRFTDEQVRMLMRLKLTGADLAEFDRLAQKDKDDRKYTAYNVWAIDGNRACKEPPPRPDDYDQWLKRHHAGGWRENLNDWLQNRRNR